MKICIYHEDYEVPLIWTFAFNGYEYWCPYCNYKTGMFGDTYDVEKSPELVERLKVFEKLTLEYLDACSTLICHSLEYPQGSGKIILRSELPIEEIERCKAVRDTGWRTNRKAEDFGG